MRHLVQVSGIVLLAILAIFQSACQKDEPDDPDAVLIEPGPYFPVYPGSFWDYSVTNFIYSSAVLVGKTYSHHRDSTAPEYIEHRYATSVDYSNCTSCPPIDDVIRFSPLSLVPFFNGFPVYYYDRILLRQVRWMGGYESYGRYPILSEEIGKSFRAEGWLDPRIPNYPLTLTAIMKTTNNSSDSVLICEEKYSHPMSNLTRKWYTKGIGLTMSVTLYSTGDTLELRTLDTCFVNKP